MLTLINPRRARLDSAARRLGYSGVTRQLAGRRIRWQILFLSAYPEWSDCRIGSTLGIEHHLYVDLVAPVPVHNKALMKRNEATIGIQRQPAR